MKIFRINSFKGFKNTGIPCFAIDEPARSNKFECQLTQNDAYLTADLILLGSYILSLTPSDKTNCKATHILGERSLRNHFQFVNNTEQYSDLLASPSSRDNTQPEGTVSQQILCETKTFIVLEILYLLQVTAGFPRKTQQFLRNHYHVCLRLSQAVGNIISFTYPSNYDLFPEIDN